MRAPTVAMTAIMVAQAMAPRSNDGRSCGGGKRLVATMTVVMVVPLVVALMVAMVVAIVVVTLALIDGSSCNGGAERNS